MSDRIIVFSPTLAFPFFRPILFEGNRTRRVTGQYGGCIRFGPQVLDNAYAVRP